MNTKRMIAALMAVALIATFAFAQHGAGRVEPQAKKKDLTGTWLLTITPDDPGAPPFEGLYAFTSDGIALFSSVGPPIPGLGNPGHGVWARTGPNSFVVTWKQFTFDDIYTCNGSLILRSTITFTSDDVYSSVDTGKVLDLSGHTVVSIGGTHQGKRMKVE
ncbi:MAG TPA: hypothetical protein VKA60_01985 [Blastocatellia bacterium]|nr:hypothetical protein [Blastocatellia bacterium]